MSARSRDAVKAVGVSSAEVREYLRANSTSGTGLRVLPALDCISRVSGVRMDGIIQELVRMIVCGAGGAGIAALLIYALDASRDVSPHLFRYWLGK